MSKFFLVLLHIFYFAAAAVAEILLWNWLVSLAGPILAIIGVVILGILLIMFYFIIFWKWRPEPGAFFDDIGDFGGGFFD